MAQLFKPGDVVYLKSGSVGMTVKGYNDYLVGLKRQISDEELTACWQIAKTLEMKCATFHQDMLTTEEPADYIDYLDTGIDA